jgi:hypothetical protein
MSEVDDSMKNSALASGGQRWSKEVGSLGWIHDWAELLTGLVKKYGEKYEMDQKNMRRNTSGLKRKRNKKIKRGRIFVLLKLRKLIQMVFDLKII